MGKTPAWVPRQQDYLLGRLVATGVPVLAPELLRDLAQAPPCP